MNGMHVNRYWRRRYWLALLKASETCKNTTANIVISLIIVITERLSILR